MLDSLLQATLSSTISWRWLRLMSIESVILSNHLIFCHPLIILPSIFPCIGRFSNESAFYNRWSKYWSFTISISSSNKYSMNMISFRINWFDLFAVQKDSQESSPASQFKSIISSVINLPYGPTLTSVYHYGKNHSFDYMVLCQQSDVSVFNTV